jgi:hypothetical protein
MLNAFTEVNFPFLPLKGSIWSHRGLTILAQMLLEDSWDQYVLVRTLLRLGLSGDDGRAVRQVFDAVMSFYAQMGKVQNLLLVVIFDELSLAAPALASSQSDEQGVWPFPFITSCDNWLADAGE